MNNKLCKAIGVTFGGVLLGAVIGSIAGEGANEPLVIALAIVGGVCAAVLEVFVILLEATRE